MAKQKSKKKGMFAQMKESSKSDKDRFTRSVTEGKDYENLYDIGSSIRRIDSENLMIGIMAVLIGALMFMFSIILPFLYGKGFHLGLWSAIGIMLILSGAFYYIGSYRILHPLSRAVNVKKDLVIRDILKTREVVYADRNDRRIEDDDEGEDEEDDE